MNFRTYRLYHFDAGDRISAWEDVTARDDDAAIVIARSHGRGLDFELWERGRRVFGSADEPAAVGSRSASEGDSARRVDALVP